MTTLTLTLTLILIVLGVGLLIDIVSGVSGGFFLARSIWYWIRGYVVVPIPEELVVAAANGVLAEGSVIVLGDAHEGRDGLISRFAISPSLVNVPGGKTLEIVKIGRTRPVLRRTATTILPKARYAVK